MDGDDSSSSEELHDVAVIVLPDDYERVITEMKTSGGSISLNNRRACTGAFQQTSQYDLVVWAFLTRRGEIVL